MADVAIVREFETKLSFLRDFPERAIILDLTKFAEIHIQYSSQISMVLIDRLLSPGTNITFKLPTFYLLDSIMKHVGGPYAALFSRRLLEAYTRAYNEVLHLI
jgi:pre-mRNA cleavage complex 2 protein Pcf11